VIENSESAIMLSVERETAAVILHSEVDRHTTAQFIMFDVVANCSSSTDNNLSSAVRTQVCMSDFFVCEHFQPVMSYSRVPPDGSSRLASLQLSCAYVVCTNLYGKLILDILNF